MVRWERGRQQVEVLIGSGELQKVVGSGDATAVLLEMAGDHVAAAKTCINVDPAGALSLSYDAARKAATAVLAHQGLRPTTRGGHLAVVNAVESQFPGVPGLRSLDRPRRRRNETEYPDPQHYDPISLDDATDAVAVAEAAIRSVQTLVDRPEVGLFR